MTPPAHGGVVAPAMLAAMLLLAGPAGLAGPDPVAAQTDAAEGTAEARENGAIEWADAETTSVDPEAARSLIQKIDTLVASLDARIATVEERRLMRPNDAVLVGVLEEFRNHRTVLLESRARLVEYATGE